MAISTVGNEAGTGVEQGPGRTPGVLDSPIRETSGTVTGRSLFETSSGNREVPQSSQGPRTETLLRNRELQLASLRRSLSQLLRRSANQNRPASNRSQFAEGLTQQEVARFESGNPILQQATDEDSGGPISAERGTDGDDRLRERAVANSESNLENLRSEFSGAQVSDIPDRSSEFAPTRVLTRLRSIDQKINQLQFRQQQREREASVSRLQRIYGHGEDTLELAERIEQMSEQVRDQVEARQISDFVDRSELASIGRLVDRRE